MEVKQLELSDQLVKYGILEVYYDNYKIEINFRRIDGDTDVVTVPVMQYAHDTLEQLDSLLNGSMSTESFTQLKYYLTLKLAPMWDQVYSSTSSKDKSKSKGKKQDGQGQKERTLEQELTEKYHFKNIQNKSLDENSDMWEKYNFIRRIRKQAVHPHTRQISVTDAGNVVDYTYQIGDWISFQS